LADASKTIKVQLLYYRGHPVEFVEQVLKARPTEQQKGALRALITDRHITIKSGHGTGKTALLGWVALWALSVFAFPKIPCTAPTGHQLEDNLWGEISKWHREMVAPWGTNIKVGAEKAWNTKYPREWFAVARTARAENPDALQGFHAKNLIFILDEASGIPEEIFEPVMGALTGPENLCIMAGNPTHNHGTFYDSHHKNRHLWKCFTFNAEDSPLVTQDQIDIMRNTYGEHSDIYRVRVLGEFAKSDPDQLIPLDVCEDAINREIVVGGPVIWGLDPAWYGDDASVICKREGNIVLPFKGDAVVHGYDTQQVAAWAAAHYNETSPRHRPDAIPVDTVGIGAGVYDAMRAMNLPVIAVNVQGKPVNPTKYANIRAEIFCRVKDWLVDGRGGLPDDDFLLAELTAIKYKYAQKGAILLEDKKETKKVLKRSPDRADSLSVTFYGSLTPRKKNIERDARPRRVDYNPLTGERREYVLR